MKKTLVGLLTLLAVVAGAYLSGPRVAVDTSVRFNAAQIGVDPAAYLAAAEKSIAGIHDNLQKEIVWAYPLSRAKTPVSIVYIHGFSASKEEIRPLPDKVAASLGANLFFTRLAGHGRDGSALAEASVNDWINDFAEAVAIGHMIGEKTVVIATSTGSGLATYGASDPDLAKHIAAMVLFSPNYAFRHPLAALATGPWAERIAELAEGEIRSFTPQNEKHGKYWTTTYPTKSGLQMAAQTKLARETAVEKLNIPVLFVYSQGDTVVDANVTKEMMARWGGPAESIVVTESEDPNNHVIAGDVLSPSNTDPLAAKILTWLKKYL